MPVYAFAPQKNTRPTHGEQAVQLGNVLSDIYGKYEFAKEKEAQQLQMERDFANFDKYSPIQQATITAKYAGQPAAAAFLKNAGQRKAYQDFFGGGENILPGQTVAPNVSQLQNAMQVAAVGDQMLAPSPMNAMQAAQAFPQQATPQAPGINPVAQMSDEKLRQGILQFPELEKGFKAELEGREAERNRAIKERQFEYGKEQDIRKETQKYVEKILDSYQGSKTSEVILSQMDNLSSKGDLTSPLMNNLLGKLGLPLGVLNNPDSEEFDKLSNNLTRDIQKFYGARILASEFNNFLRQIPTLQNSPEGRKRVIENLQKMLLPAKFEYQTYKDILKENAGKRPPNIREQIMERMDPLLEKWSQDFKSSIQKSDPSKVPEGTLVIISPDGRRVAVPKEHVAAALSQGGQLE